MKTLFSKTSSFILLIVIFLSAIFGCKKDDPGTPPEIPPESSFVMDFSDFEQDEEKLNILADDYSNYQRAVAHVFVWNVVISIHLAVPVATFVHSFDHTPEYQADEESWKWSYDVVVGNNTYTANLYGKVFDTYIKWDMYVSKTGIGAFTDFHWYFGTSDKDNSSGEWTLHASPSEPHEFVEIVWNKNLSDDNYEIKYTNIVPDGPENGGYITYGFTNDELYNAFYKIYNKGEDNLIEIDWHRTNKNGRIKDPAFFEDDEFRCWDELFFNTECLTY